MYIGTYDITKSQLKKASNRNLLRLAIYINLKYELLNMSNRQLAKLIRWRLTRNRNGYEY